MIGHRKRKGVDLIHCDPPVVNRTAQHDMAGPISTPEDIHDNPEMRVGVSDSCEGFNDLHGKVDLLLDLSKARLFGCFSSLHPATREFPEAAQEA